MLQRICALLLLLAVVSAAPALAVAGATDRTPGASLLVPFFETGVNSTTHPHDTLLVVTNWLNANETFHWHVWDIDGNPTTLNGNVTLGNLQTWSAAMRDLLNTASPTVRTQLTEGSFFRGFMTIDVVTAATALYPRQGSYPFSDANALEGFIYYTRLSQGSANGLAMVPLEALPNTANAFVRGFYSAADSREELDSLSRACANAFVNTPSSTGCDSDAVDDGDIDRVHLRIFRSTPLSGSSRAVVFTWNPNRFGGPSSYCGSLTPACATSYTFRQYDENGNFVQNRTIALNHVVNVIENSDIVGTLAGWLSIFDVPNANLDTHVYGFSFNSAAPAGNPNLTWDAIFEAYIVP